MMTYNKKSVEDIDVKGKKIIARCDFNVPQDADLNITDDKRITASLPTIKYLIEQGAAVVLCSHLGRPKGEANPKYSLAPVAKRLSELLGQEVALAADVIGEDAKAKAAALKAGEVMLLENVRFHKEEDGKDEVAKEAYAKELAALVGEDGIYVNDAFGTAHRSHASTAVLSKFLPAVCGKLIQKELEIMGGALEAPVRPFVSILGGAKVSDKIGVITNLIEKCDTIVIGGAMAYTFAKAAGAEIGKSRCEEDKLDLAKSIVEKAQAKGVKLLLPVDSACAADFADVAPTMCETNAIPAELMGLDIGPKAIAEYCQAVADAGTVVWNGPMGVFEFENYAAGTKSVAEAIANSNAISIIGGGDSAAAVEILGFADKMTHISTGGGASLEFLEGLELPGIACLLDK
ncbi:MAG: phosphoglycerate kinase [Clostridia bacterium]